MVAMAVTRGRDGRGARRGHDNVGSRRLDEGGKPDGERRVRRCCCGVRVPGRRPPGKSLLLLQATVAAGSRLRRVAAVWVAINGAVLAFTGSRPASSSLWRWRGGRPRAWDGGLAGEGGGEVGHGAGDRWRRRRGAPRLGSAAGALADGLGRGRRRLGKGRGWPAAGRGSRYN
jgi:hypothetical protein